MSPLRRLTRLARPPVRAFHSPLAALGPSGHLTTPTTPTYEKQHDSSPEPHLSSSGTRTYVVSEPDPSDTPYQVPSGAYPASTPYVNLGPTEALSPLIHPSNNHTLGGNAAIKNTEAPRESGRRRSGLMDNAAGTKPGRF